MHNTPMCVGLILAVLLARTVCASDLPLTRPEDVGFSSERLAEIDKFYTEKVARGELAGIVMLVARHGKVAHFSAVGYANVATRQPMRTNTLFRFYSVTKPITATALMMLYEEGRFQMKEPVSKYIPEFAHVKVVRTPDSDIDDAVPVEREPTIQDLLRHTAGFGIGFGDDPVDRRLAARGIYDRDVSLAEMMSKIAQVPLRYPPGSRWAYSLSSDVQARLVEVLSGIPFDEFLERRLFKRLGIEESRFRLSPEQYKRLAAVHWTKNGTIVPWDHAHGHPIALDHEPFASINEEAGDARLTPGSFGLIGTVADYWRFAQMILNRGELNGVRILSPSVVRYMTQDHLGAIDSTMLGKIENGTGFGLGFGVIRDAPAAGFMNGEGSVFWDGAATTLWWTDPKADLVVVAMTQYLDSSGPNLASLRPQVRALVYGALLE